MVVVICPTPLYSICTIGRLVFLFLGKSFDGLGEYPVSSFSIRPVQARPSTCYAPCLLVRDVVFLFVMFGGEGVFLVKVGSIVRPPGGHCLDYWQVKGSSLRSRLRRP